MMPKQDKGSMLCNEWGLNVRQFRYSEWGNWYGLIDSYPAEPSHSVDCQQQLVQLLKMC